MAITPDTNIRILKLPFEIDNKNQLTFSNVNEQTKFFESLNNIEIDECYYQRKDNIIMFPEHIDKIIQYNYVMYKNEYYTNKWFYAFIDKMEYENEGTTKIYIKTDVFQTWQFDIIYKKMFVEREMVTDDTIGLHTVPEGLELGEYICDEIRYYNGLDDFVYIIRVTEFLNGEKPLATNFGGVVSAGGAYICSTVNEVVNIIQGYSAKGKEDSVISVYMCPRVFVNNSNSTNEYSGQNSPIYEEFTLEKPTSLNGYVPVNKKLLTFPYCFLNLSNNNGSSNTFQYELFNDEIKFNIKGVPVIRKFN